MSNILDPQQNSRLRSRQAVETQDFTAVILVGTGENVAVHVASSFYTYTSLYPFNQGINVLPKALIPVGNTAVVNLVLDWVFAAGLTDILIIVPPSAEAAMSEYLQQSYTPASHPRAHITLKSYTDASDDEEDDDDEERPGTARMLKRFRTFIKSDFVLLPCDVSFPSTLTLSSILDKHRATPDAVLTSVFYEAPELVKESEEKLLVGTDRETDELLLVQGLETLEEDLELRMGLLESHPRLSLTTRLLDSHVYVFRRTVLDLLATRRSKDLSSIREQFVPWLVKGAWQQGLGHQWAPILCPPRRDPLAGALARSLSMPYDKVDALKDYEAPSSTASEHTPLPGVHPSVGEELAEFKAAIGKTGKSARKSAKADPVPWTCRVIVAKPVTPPAPKQAEKGNKGKQAAEPEPEYLVRANSLPGYWEINRRFVRNAGAAFAAAAAGGATPVAATTNGAAAEISATAQISPDSLVDEGVRVGDRASIKKCIVGRHCNIGKGAKLTGCVLWDFVTVEDNARLENVVLCSNVRIGEKASIKDCEFGPGFEALPGATLKGERLIAGQEA